MEWYELTFWASLIFVLGCFYGGYPRGNDITPPLLLVVALMALLVSGACWLGSWL